jgi:hypothetical protein
MQQTTNVLTHMAYISANDSLYMEIFYFRPKSETRTSLPPIGVFFLSLNIQTQGWREIDVGRHFRIPRNSAICVDHSWLQNLLERLLNISWQMQAWHTPVNRLQSLFGRLHSRQRSAYQIKNDYYLHYVHLPFYYFCTWLYLISWS